MNKNRKKMIFIISTTIIIGIFGFVGFSPVFSDMIKRASAQNEGELEEGSALIENENSEEDVTTEAFTETLTIEDTVYALTAGGEGEGSGIKLSTVDDYTKLQEGKYYIIIEYEDWKRLQEFSTKSNLKGMIFFLQYPGGKSGEPWELSADKGFTTGLGTKECPFAGTIKPLFNGMIIQADVPLFNYLSSDANIGNDSNDDVNNPMKIINTVSSTSEGEGAGGLAVNYVLKSGSTVNLGGTESRFKNIKIAGTIDVKGTAGGLFGNVILDESIGSGDGVTESSATIILESSSISFDKKTEVKGYIAGGLFGEVSGNITMTLSSMPSVAARVYGYYDGYANGSGTYVDGVISQMKVCSGGLIGKMTNEAVLQTSFTGPNAETGDITYLTIKNLVISDGISGGLIGAVQNSTVNVACVEKDCDTTKLYDKEFDSTTEPYVWARYIGGGFIGLVDSSKVELNYLKLNADIKVCYTGGKIKSSAGGIVGRYITDEEDTQSYLKISNLCTGNTQRMDVSDGTDTTQRIFVSSRNSENNNNCGGIIGSCNGNYLDINTIELTPEKYNVSLNYKIWSESLPYQKGSKSDNDSYVISGAVAGSLSGMSIEISNIIFDLRHNSGTKCEYSNGISGYYVGDIAGKVGTDRTVVYGNSGDVITDIQVPTKMKVSNITVKNSYAFTAYKYQGGLFGYVGKGALICLSDTIDISQIPFRVFTSGNADRVNAWAIYVMLAPTVNGGSRGLIAGYAEESLIYFEEGANVTRSIKQENGCLVSNMLENDTPVAFNPDDATYYEFVIDDIGNAGSVFQNLKDSNGTLVIDYSKDYGKEVTEAVGKVDGKYVIDSLGDALRLAIVGQTFDMSTGELTFASNCFADSTTISDVLSADYLITTDLNLGAANIQSFLRSDATLNGSVLGFSGSMEGQNTSNTSPTITMNSISRHKNGGLYPLLQSASNDAVSFKNLTIDGYMYYHLGSYNTTTKKSEGGSGSIAARAIGNCSFENITIKTKIKGDMYDTIFTSSSNTNNRMYSHGGLIGEYQLNGGILSVTGCEFSPEITTIRSSNFVGGMIGRIDTSKQKGTININDCTVGTKITADSNFMLLKSSDKTNKFHARAAGLISFIGNDYAKVASISNDWAKFYPGTVEDETYAEITINDIDLKGASIDLSNVSSTSVNISGGLLGYAWCNVDVKMNDINVGGTEDADKCVINSLGYVGGLVSFIAGKVDLSDIALNQLAMTSVDIGRSYCSFLFGNGECAYITIDQATYAIDSGDVTITNYSENFDEIVGSNIPWTFNNDNNKEFNATIITGYRDGGIVNIVNTNFSNFKSEEGKNAYQSYINRVCTTTNQYTRYYYNLFSDNDSNSWNIGSDMNNLNINTPQKLMTWHVGNYANSNLTHFFKAYFGGNGSYREVKNVTLSGKLDMNGYSLYPTSVDGVIMSGSNAEVILYGAEISDLEENLKSGGSNLVYRNNDLVTFADSTYSYVKTQHYMMHSSLLYCVTDATISNLKMSGTIANNCQDSGSLIGGYSLGSINISGIVFHGLKVSNYDKISNVDEQSSAALMLARVGFMANGTSVSTSAYISDISMEGYTADDVSIAASALVSQAGNSASKDVQITFKNMKLMYEKASSPFKYATFLYRFEYSSDSKDNKSYGIYTFNYEDTVDSSYKKDNHNVTYGSEIKNGLHYDDIYLKDVENGKDNPLEDAINNEKEIDKGNYYLPYTATNNKDIYVNPKSGDITEGCGTYEDPYIIENVSQFMTLFCYLTGEHDSYQFFLQSGNSKWKVVPIGGDGDAYECNGEHKEIASYGEENFPTVDEMRTAYYMITEDIDLVGGADMNYAALVKRYSGLGSYKYPFAGVIVGSEKDDGNYPTITIPGAGDWTNYSNLGLIEYMQGAVVKDINIKNNSWPVVTNSAGGVAAVILGGDNIIDNVTVSIEIRINNANIGGYVGTIENGSLILRNIEGKEVVKGCKFYSHFNNADYDKPDYYTTATKNNTVGLFTTNTKVGLLVGTVKDGYVLYDGNEFGVDKKVLTNADVNVTGVEDEVSPLINGFELINGAALDTAISSSGKIAVNDKKVNSNLGEYDYEVRIKNAEQLEIIALALNSDSLSVYIDGSHSDAENRTEHLSGYDYTAKCRKAKYTEVGSATAKNRGSTDCQFAKTYDDGFINNSDADTNSGTTTSNYYSYPYLCYKYMTFNKTDTSATNYEQLNYEQFKSTICVATSDSSSTKYISKLNKADENVKQYTTTYKLRDNAGIYDLSVYGNSFRGIGALYSKEYSDFRGNFDGDNHSVKIYMNRDWDSKLAITGMFNSLIYHNKNAAGENEALTIKKLVIVDSVFQNTLNTDYINGANQMDELQGAARGAATGALAGEMEGVWEIKDITFKRTDTAESTETQSEALAKLFLSDGDYKRELVCGVRGYMNVGGLIGRVNVTDIDSNYGNEALHESSNDIEIKRCNIEGYSDTKAVNIQLGSNGFTAGGFIGSIGANINSKNYNASLKKYFYFGNVTIEGCSVTYVNVLAKDSGFLGGFAGTVGYRHDQCYRSIGSVKVSNNITVSNNETIETPNKLTNVNILSDTQNDTDDKYSAGGVFGQVEVLAIRELKKDSEGRTERNFDINTVKKESMIHYTYLDNVTVNIQSTNDSNGTYNLSNNSNGIGGLIGYLNCRKMSIYKVEVTKSHIGVNEDVYAKTNVGGLIGFSSSNGAWCEATKNNSLGFYANFLEMSYVKVTNSEILCDQNSASAGGFIGYMSNDATSILGSGYENQETGKTHMYYSTSQGNTISCSGSGSHSGGIIGYTKPSSYVLPGYTGNAPMINNHWICYIDVLNNNITSKNANAGGLIGYFAEGGPTSNSGSYYYNELHLGYIRIGSQEDLGFVDMEPVVGDVSNQIIGLEHAGGLCGYTDATTSLAYVAPIKVGMINKNGYYNTIAARVAGGLIGKNQSIYEYFSTDDIEILQNRIASSTNTYGQVTASGGACGVRYYNKTDAISATYKIKENVIVTTGNAKEAIKDKVSFSCGGVYGKVDYGSGSNKQYFDDIVLSNNSIGYYKPAIVNTGEITEIVEKINKLTNTSQEVCLLQRSSSGFAHDNWRKININESNVGDYSDRIGNFFGEYTESALNALHCVILRPTVEYSKEIGSIPAIDVGQTKASYQVTTSPSEYGYLTNRDSGTYGTAYPYGYRAKCHIIYLDDYLESENIIDISSSDNDIKPTLDASVLMQHGTTTVTTSTTDENGETITTTSEEPVYETEYFFGGIDSIVSNYKEVKYKQTAESDSGFTDSTYAFLTSKRLDITLGGNENSNLICASPDSDDYFEATYINSENQYNGVPVIEVDGQSVQYIGDYVAAILTNGGGIYNRTTSNTFKNFLTISCVNAYIAPDGTIHAVGENDVIAGTGESHEASIVVVDNVISSQDCPYDVVIGNDGNKYYTISLLCYTYHSYNYDRTENKETIYIPVFVTKKVTVNSYLSILEGEEYLLDTARSQGYKDEVMISHDSTYTVYSEFVYDDVRMEEDFCDIIINKTLVFEKSISNNEYEAINMSVGTKMTLVDVQTGKEYYYEVPAQGASKIAFSDFKDADDKPYSQRNIGNDITITEENYESINYKNSTDSPDVFSDTVGLERFFIVVRPSGQDSNISFRLSIQTEAVDNNSADKEESVRKFIADGIRITNIYGPLIGFEGVSSSDGTLVGTDGVTQITGTISKEKVLEIDGRIRVSLDPDKNSTNTTYRGLSPYWDYKSTGNAIDSANSGKYLEIGVTLIDTTTNQEVQWPEGTNVRINGGEQMPLMGNSVIYAYKDDNKEFSFDTITHNIANKEWYYYDISEGKGNPNYQWITNSEDGWYYQVYDTNGTTLEKKKLGFEDLNEAYIFASNQCHLEFDFSVADIKDYVGKDYIVKINLYRSSDPDFPLEEVGTAVLDGSIREYWKVIQAEGNVDLAAAITPNDLLELGINLYGDTQDTYEISFTNKIDFTNMISTNETAAGNDVEECAGKNYMVVYRIYKKTPNSNGNGYTYELVDLDDTKSPFSLYDITTQESPIQISKISVGSDENEAQTMENAFVTTKTFTAEEINEAVKSPQYVVTWQMKLTVDSNNITNEDLANYKVEATYLPYEGDQPTSDSESTLKDYFIFTIAKLKTDF